MKWHPGQQALRKGRVSLPGQVYLVTAVTARRTRWFRDVINARVVCRLMVDPRTWGDARILCWVLMPDHWHGLVELGGQDGLALVMNRMKARATKRLGAHGCDQPIWTRGFHDHALRRTEDARAATRYVIANPVRAGLVQR